MSPLYRFILGGLLTLPTIACGDKTGPADLAIPATLILTTAPPASAQSRVIFNPQPVVQLRDVNGVAVAQAGTVVTAGITTGEGTLGGSITATTASTGTATFTDLSIAGTVGEKTLTFTATGLTSATAGLSLTAGTPASLTPHDGNNQSAAMGTAVAVPPSVKVEDADANPVSGVSVTFAVVEGGGSITGSTQTTDGSGIATIGSWTLGSTAANRLTATAEGLPASPVNFDATGIATDLCRSTSSSAIPLETEVAGALRASDCIFHGGQFHDFYNFTLASQQAVMISLRSQAFDPSVDLFTLMDQRDRGVRSDTVDSSREARLKAILPPGAYQTAASSVQVRATGPYTLRVAATTSDVESCEAVFVVRGVTTTQEVSFSDCVDGSGFYYADIYGLSLDAGERVTLTQSSTEFVPQVLLYRGADLLAQADGFTNGKAVIDFEADATGLFYFVATSGLILEVGAYTMTISDPGPGPASARLAAPRSLGLPGEILEFSRSTLEGPLHWKRH